MGSAREVTFASLTEPALFFAFLVLARLSGTLSLSGMLHSGRSVSFPPGSVAPLIMVAIGLFIVYLAENSRIPVDDPTTHLELTMIHEAMVLDHSGSLFGLIEYASSMKLFVIASVLVNVIIPTYTDLQWLDWLIFTGSVIALAFATGVIESVIGRLRMSRVPSLLIAAVLLCGSAFIMLVR